VSNPRVLNPILQASITGAAHLRFMTGVSNDEPTAINHCKYQSISMLVSITLYVKVQ